MKKEADRDDLQIQEIKKTMTIENYFSLSQEHKMQKDQIHDILRNAERQQEIIDDLRITTNKLKQDIEEMRANNEEMRQFIKKIAKKNN